MRLNMSGVKFNVACQVTCELGDMSLDINLKDIHKMQESEIGEKVCSDLISKVPSETLSDVISTAVKLQLEKQFTQNEFNRTQEDQKHNNNRKNNRNRKRNVR